jgi:S1-C subfamily serine protease
MNRINKIVAVAVLALFNSMSFANNVNSNHVDNTDNTINTVVNNQNNKDIPLNNANNTNNTNNTNNLKSKNVVSNSVNTIKSTNDLDIKSLIETYNLNGKASNNSNNNIDNKTKSDSASTNSTNDNSLSSNSNENSTIINKLIETNKIIKNIQSNDDTDNDSHQSLSEMNNKSFYNANNDFINQANLDSIVKVQVKNIVSNEKESVGSGFFISKDGEIISNFHVISGHIKDPNITKVVVSIGTDPKEYEVKIKNIDVLNDLSLLKLDVNPLEHINFNINTLDNEDITLGTKVFSVGFPNNWRLTVSDGLLNGFFDKRIIKNYLVSYPLTPGMSGGPTYNKKGQVIGINVATSNALSMIIPAKSTMDLLNSKNWLPDNIKSEDVRVNQLKNKVFSQISAYNDVVLDRLNHAQPVALNSVNLNVKSDFLECWSKQKTKSDNDDEKLKRYNNITYVCGNEDSIFYNEETSFGNYYFMVNYFQQKLDQNKKDSNLFNKIGSWTNSYYFHQVNEKLFNALVVANQKSIDYDNDEGCMYLNDNKLFVCKNSINIFKDDDKNHKLYQIKAVMFSNSENGNETVINNFIYNGFTNKQLVKFVEYLESLDNK